MMTIDTFGAAVREYLSHRSGNRPNPAGESYYANSSHSNHNHALYYGLLREKGLRWEDVTTDPETYAVLAKLETFFQITYIMSAIWDAIHSRESTDWFHDPMSIKITFQELMDGDTRACLGRTLTTEAFRSDPIVAECWEKWQTLLQSFDWRSRQNTPEQTQALTKLHTFFLEKVAELRRHIMEMLERYESTTTTTA